MNIPRHMNWIPSEPVVLSAMEWTIATVCSLGLGVALYFFAGEHLWLAIPAAIVLFFAIILTMRYFARRSR